MGPVGIRAIVKWPVLYSVHWEAGLSRPTQYTVGLLFVSVG